MLDEECRTPHGKDLAFLTKAYATYEKAAAAANETSSLGKHGEFTPVVLACVAAAHSPRVSPRTSPVPMEVEKAKDLISSHAHALDKGALLALKARRMEERAERAKAAREAEQKALADKLLMRDQPAPAVAAEPSPSKKKSTTPKQRAKIGLEAKMERMEQRDREQKRREESQKKKSALPMAAPLPSPDGAAAAIKADDWVESMPRLAKAAAVPKLEAAIPEEEAAPAGEYTA